MKADEWKYTMARVTHFGEQTRTLCSQIRDTCHEMERFWSGPACSAFLAEADECEESMKEMLNAMEMYLDAMKQMLIRIQPVPMISENNTDLDADLIR